MSATQEPEFPDLIARAIEAALLDVHTSLIGHVVRFDASKNTVDVRPVIRAQVLGDDGDGTEELPILPNVRITYARGGGWSQTFPLAVGDPVRVLFSEQYTGGYRFSGQTGQDPGLFARFDLSSAVAIPCDERDTSAAEVSSTDWIINGPGAVRVGGAGALAVAIADQVKAYVDAAIVAHAHPYAGPSGPATTSAGAYTSGAPPISVAASKLRSE